MKISSNVLEKIKEVGNIYDIVSSYVNLIKKNKNFVSNCPFHKEKTPSFFIYPESDSFYCFGCHTGGDVVTFIKLIENLNYIESINFLAKRLGIKIEEDSNFDDLNFKKKLVYELNRKSAAFFHLNLFEKTKSSEFALKYLVSRGINSKTIKRFGIGFAPNSKNKLLDYLKSKSYKENDIIDSNLAYKNNYANVVSRFFNRIIFPIFDLNGNVIAFGARSLGQAYPKYINTSNTIVFKKSKNLYSLNFALKSKKKYVILVEGYMDVISLYQIGFDNVVASLGTSLTNEQAKILSKHFENIYLVYDSDEAGLKATQKAIEVFKKYEIQIKVISVPDAKDPDEFINKNGLNSKFLFSKLIDLAQNDILYVISIIKNKFNLEKYEEKISFLNEASKILSKINNPIEREIYTSKICLETKISKNILENQIKKLRKKENKILNIKNLEKSRETFKNNFSSHEKNKSKYFRIYYIEKILLSCIIKSKACPWEVFGRLNVDDFVSDFFRIVFKRVLDLKNEGESIDVINISRDFDDRQSSELARILGVFSDVKLSEEEIFEYIKRMKMERKYLELQNGDSSLNEINKYINLLKSDKNNSIRI